MLTHIPSARGLRKTVPDAPLVSTSRINSPERTSQNRTLSSSHSEARWFPSELNCNDLIQKPLDPTSKTLLPSSQFHIEIIALLLSSSNTPQELATARSGSLGLKTNTGNPRRLRSLHIFNQAPFPTTASSGVSEGRKSGDGRRRVAFAQGFNRNFHRAKISLFSVGSRRNLVCLCKKVC